MSVLWPKPRHCYPDSISVAEQLGYVHKILFKPFSVIPDMCHCYVCVIRRISSISCCSRYRVYSRRHDTRVCSVVFVRRPSPRPGRFGRIGTIVGGCCCHVVRCTCLACSRHDTRVYSVGCVRRPTPRPGRVGRIGTIVGGCCCHVARCTCLACSRHDTRVCSVVCIRRTIPPSWEGWSLKQ